jgi:hypothetical protein
LWGWGEEGQLGNGTEKDGVLPKPCRIPPLMGIQSTSILPVDISLGACHSVILVQNTDFRPVSESSPIPISKVDPLPSPQKESEMSPKHPEPPQEQEIEEIPPPIEIPPPEPPVVIERIPITPLDVVKKEGMMVVHEVQEAPPVLTPIPIRSLKDILHAREERKYCLTLRFVCDC